MSKFKKAAIISAGAATSAYGGGTLARINKNYDLAIGISTGALMSPLTVLGEWDLLKLAYTTMMQNDFFDDCWYKPSQFKKDGTMRALPLLISLLVGDKTISTSKNLRKTIERLFTKEMYNRILEKNKNIIVASQNIIEEPAIAHYFNLKYETYDDFVDWIWCSCNVPLHTSLVKKNWTDEKGKFHVGLWCDVGIHNLPTLKDEVGNQVKEVDIILLKPKPEVKFEGKRILNLVDNVCTTINAMKYDIELDELKKKINELTQEGVKVTIWWLPRKLTNNSLIFNKKQMTEWWNEGYATAFDKNRMEVFEPNKSKID